jgi:uncharacterized protein
MDPVVHFEMPYEDRERLSGFYESVFGWKMRGLGADMGHYVLATTTETGENGPERPGAINGGFFPARQDAQHPCFVIAVENVAESARRVQEAGGTMLGEPMAIPGVGQYAPFLDSEGNRVVMLQPIPRNWHGPDSEE